MRMLPAMPGRTLPYGRRGSRRGRECAGVLLPMPQSRLFPGIGFSWAQSMANQQPNPVTQLKSPPTVPADPAGIQQAMAKVGNVIPLKAENGRLGSSMDAGGVLQHARLRAAGQQARQVAKPEITKAGGDATQASYPLPGGEHAHGLGRSSLLASATPADPLAAMPALLAKLAAPGTRNCRPLTCEPSPPRWANTLYQNWFYL